MLTVGQATSARYSSACMISLARGEMPSEAYLQVVRDALHSAEQEGIVFIDEIDKIVSPSGSKLGGE